MVELMMKNQVLLYCAGITVLGGILARLITSISLKRLLRAASNMSKSNHALMRLVRAKFEHTCMISDKVQNVQAFVEKYLYEYRVLGIRLYTWRNIEKTFLALCAIFGVTGGVIAYTMEGDLVKTQNYGTIGGAGTILLLLLQITGNEKGKLEAIKMYMIEFLENTYAHRYEKIPRNVGEEAEPAPENEIVVEPEIEPEVQVPKQIPIPPAEPELQPVQAARIREILEEFLA